jgi:hypothetical protein
MRGRFLTECFWRVLWLRHWSIALHDHDMAATSMCRTVLDWTGDVDADQRLGRRLLPFLHADISTLIYICTYTYKYTPYISPTRARDDDDGDDG